MLEGIAAGTGFPSEVFGPVLFCELARWRPDLLASEVCFSASLRALRSAARRALPAVMMTTKGSHQAARRTPKNGVSCSGNSIEFILEFVNRGK